MYISRVWAGLTLLTLVVSFFATPTKTAAARPFILGAWQTEADLEGKTLEQFEQELGIFFTTHKRYTDWYQSFDIAWGRAMHAAGRMPEFTWQPWSAGVGIRFGDIAGGSYDAYIRQAAKDVKTLGFTVQIAIAPEMNGWWSPWAINGQPGRTNTDYINGYRRMVDIFNQEGTTAVEWIWAPNVVDSNSPVTYQFSQLYPGDAYVTFMGLDGYNWGDYLGGTWQSFRRVYEYSYSLLTAISSKDILIMEIGCNQTGGDKAAWIHDMFAQLPSFPKIRGFTWFNRNREVDWRIASSPASKQAFREAAAQWLPILNGTPTPSPSGNVSMNTKNTPKPTEAPTPAPTTQPSTAPTALTAPIAATKPTPLTERNPLPTPEPEPTPIPPLPTPEPEGIQVVAQSVEGFWRDTTQTPTGLVIAGSLLLAVIGSALHPVARRRIRWAFNMMRVKK